MTQQNLAEISPHCPEPLRSKLGEEVAKQFGPDFQEKMKQDLKERDIKELSEPLPVAVMNIWVESITKKGWLTINEIQGILETKAETKEEKEMVESGCFPTFLVTCLEQLRNRDWLEYKLDSDYDGMTCFFYRVNMDDEVRREWEPIVSGEGNG